MKSFFTLSLHLLISCFLFSQSPLGIPYQAVMRNADGTVMASSAVSLTFMIHDASATGTVVYQESHALTSNAQGLVSCVVGNGVVSQGNFANINWGSGAKFLHVMMGTTDLGTQQMLSVPYALYSNGVDVRVSETGDTLTIGGNSVIVPGISAANANNNNIPTSGLGAVVLPGNNTCADQFINVVGCNGQTSLTYDGRTYDLVEIGGQCWFADNLATDQYRNGDLIPTGPNFYWGAASIGAYSVYNNDIANDVTYGKLYNWYATVDSRGLCPAGWRVPTDCEWMYLEGSLGMTVQHQQLTSIGFTRGIIEGGMLKSFDFWNSPNTGATNLFAFNALPGGLRNFNNVYESILSSGYWWSSSDYGIGGAWCRSLSYNTSIINRSSPNNTFGFSVRCLKETDLPILTGCTNGEACNFLANAAQDDGSCMLQGDVCDDGLDNTRNDGIDENCQCSGTLIVNFCTNPLACNYNPAATQDDGSCFIQGSPCNDGNVNTINDLINAYCQCAGTPIGNGQGNGVADVDGNFYTSIIINGKEWMQQNLAVTKYRNGYPIASGLSNEAWKITANGASAIYMDDMANNSAYGKLYNWYALNDLRGLCPAGWHVPSDAEWTFLENSLGGSSIAGGKLKSTNLWTAPNTGANNESGFSALPGGYRIGTGNYGAIGSYGSWWSSTENNSSNGWYRSLNYSSANVQRGNNTKLNGLSVRCVRD